jgi:hypothetical protein
MDLIRDGLLAVSCNAQQCPPAIGALYTHCDVAPQHWDSLVPMNLPQPKVTRVIPRGARFRAHHKSAHRIESDQKRHHHGYRMALHEELLYDAASGQLLTAGYYGCRALKHADLSDPEG